MDGALVDAGSLCDWLFGLFKALTKLVILFDPIFVDFNGSSTFF
jgi:hypothetical protein